MSDQKLAPLTPYQEPEPLQPFSREDLENLKRGAPNYTARDIWDRVMLTVEQGYCGPAPKNGKDSWLPEGESERVRELQQALSKRTPVEEEHSAILEHHRLEIQRLREAHQRVEDRVDADTKNQIVNYRDLTRIKDGVGEHEHRLNRLEADLEMIMNTLRAQSAEKAQDRVDQVAYDPNPQVRVRDLHDPRGEDSRGTERVTPFPPESPGEDSTKAYLFATTGVLIVALVLILAWVRSILSA